MEADATHRPCPRCSEPINLAATRCYHCQSDLDDEGAGAGKWVAGNAAVVIPVCTFLYVAFQVFKASDYEVNTAVELVRESGISTIFVGVLLVQLPLELGIAILAGSLWWVQRPAGDSGSRKLTSRLRSVRWSRNPVSWVATVVVLLELAISPWLLAVISVAVIAWALWASSPGRSPVRRRVFSWVSGATMVAGVLVLLSRPTIWMAAEDIHMSNGHEIVGYVVSSDDRWTTVLTPSWTSRLASHSNSLIRLDTATITSRTLCAINFSDARLFGLTVRLRVFQLPRDLTADHAPRSLTPTCPKL